jgi:hydrogenase-4 component H
MQLSRVIKPVKLLLIALKTGRVSREKYPLGPPLITDSFRGAISIDPVKCRGCGACVLICPPNALTLRFEGEKAILEYFKGRCIFCGMCADVCPVQAITVTREFELATVEVEDLKEEIVHVMSKCIMCGRPFETITQLKYVKELKLITEKYINMCPECRSKRVAKLFAMKPGEIFEIK